ncbi:MAG: hypothetical protein Q4C34_00300 [Bacteroidales bacterium]|nr:hypothetical protein [Bacteroidales bacterium]
MRLLLSIILSTFFITVCAGSRVIVVDNDSGAPVGSATVFSRSGSILGMTDGDGVFTNVSDRDYPLTVKCLGYLDESCASGCDTVRMIATSYELGEVTVSTAERPILHMICYIREYSGGATSDDTIQSYAEHMADFYIPLTKVKKFKGRYSPRILRSRLYERKTDSSGLDSVYHPDYRRDDISWIDLISLPEKTVNETDGIRSGATSDSVAGKYGIKNILRKTGGTYIENVDHLADKKDHSWSPAIFKLLGMTIEISELRSAWAYQANDSGIYNAADIIYGTFSLDVTGKGRWIKKAFNSSTPIALHSFFEIYPVESEHLTVDEAKDQIKNNPPKVRMTRSPLAPALPASIQSIIDRLTK